jgi:membrane protein
MVAEYRRDRIGDVAAGITFWMLVSIPAGVLAFVSALSWMEFLVGKAVVDDARRDVETFINDSFSESTTVQATVSDLFDGAQPGLFTITTLIAFYSLSRGFAALIRALDVAYEVEEGRSWAHLRVVAMGLGLSSVIVVGGVAVTLALLADSGLGLASAATSYLVALLVLVTWATTIFHIAPFHRSPWRQDIPGAVLTAFGWAAAPQVFALYVRVSSSGNQVTSALGTIVLGLMLLYALSVLLLLGAELNDVLTRRAGSARKLDRPRMPRTTSSSDE